MKKMPTIICTLCLIVAFSSSRAQSKNNQIQFIGSSWSDALKQASAQNKYIFVDGYTTWCGPCNMMKATTFRNNKAAAFFNQKFINVAIDLERGDGPQLAAKFNIRAVPALMIFNTKGEYITIGTGYMSASKLISFAQEALNR